MNHLVHLLQFQYDNLTGAHENRHLESFRKAGRKVTNLRISAKSQVALGKSRLVEKNVYKG